MAKLEPFSRCRSETTSRRCSSQNSAPERSAWNGIPRTSTLRVVVTEIAACSVMAGLVPAIHVLAAATKTWMPGSSPGMTVWMDQRASLENSLSHRLFDELVGGLRQELVSSFAIN